MKAILEFSMPEEEEEFNLTLNASKMNSAIYEFQNLLRGLVKYGHHYTSTEEAITKIREDFFRILNEHNVSV